MRSGRLVLAALLAAGLAPGLWWRQPVPPRHWHAPVEIAALALAPATAGPFRSVGVWHLTSRRIGFGGYSALLEPAPGELLAFSDAGLALEVKTADERPVSAAVRPFLRHQRGAEKEDYDVESATRDPASGTVWLGKEMVNALERFDAALAPRGSVRPPAMAGWEENGGAESMVRLADGRFLVVQESSRAWFSAVHRGLLFAGDPLDPATPPPRRFAVELPSGFSPVDIAALPDGRVLILLRRLDFPFPPRFSSALAIADPGAVRPGRLWPARLLAVLGQGWPQDNYEGLAIDPAPAADGTVGIWMISDDNLMVRFQRTLLVRMRMRLAG